MERIYFKGGYFKFELSGLDFEYRMRAFNTFLTDGDDPMIVDHNRDELDLIPLEGYYVDFGILRDEFDPEDDTINQMQFILKVQDVLLQPGESITNSTVVNVYVQSGSMTAEDFYGITGAFAEQEFDIETNTIAIDAFEQMTNGSLLFDDPVIEFYIESYLGLPVSLDLSNFRVNTNKSPDGTNLVLYDAKAGEIDPVESFEPKYSDLSPRFDTIRIDKATSNIVDVFAEIPNKVIFSTSATITNQLGSFASIPANDDDIFIKISGLATLPLNVAISNVEQVIDFNGISSSSTVI